MSARDRLYRVEAVILKRTDMGEADRLLTLLTPDRGKLRAVAKGARKPASRKSGHVELFNRVNLLLAKGRDLDIITQADTLDAHLPLRSDLERLSYGYYLAELLDRFCEEGTENRPLYDLVLKAFSWVAESKDLALTMRFIELQVLQHVGYRPQLFRCVQCGNEIQPIENYFTAEGGGILDPTCRDSHRDRQAVTLNALKVLRYLQTRDYSAVRELHISAGVQAEVEFLMQQFITYHLERNLKSVEFLRLLRSVTAAPDQVARLPERAEPAA